MRALIAFATLLAGCATTGDGPPDTAADIGAATGRAAAVVLGQLPVVNTAIGAVDEARAKLAERRERRAGAASAARTEDRRWEQCRENPCLYAARCAELFPDEFMVPDCGDTRGAASDPYGDARTSQATRDPGAATPTLHDTIKAAEGPMSFSPRNGHVCAGHSITAAERAAGVFNPESGGTIPLEFPMTPAECEALLDEDIAEARTEARRVFGRAGDARAELCYWKPCARMFGAVAAKNLADAVESHERLLSIDRVRTYRIAGALERAP